MLGIEVLESRGKDFAFLPSLAFAVVLLSNLILLVGTVRASQPGDGSRTSPHSRIAVRAPLVASPIGMLMLRSSVREKNHMAKKTKLAKAAAKIGAAAGKANRTARKLAKSAGKYGRAEKTKLESAAIQIGAAVGKADRAAHQTAHKVAQAAHIAREELHQVGKQLEGLKRQLAKSNKRLQQALK